MKSMVCVISHCSFTTNLKCAVLSYYILTGSFSVYLALAHQIPSATGGKFLMGTYS